jgi:2-polyprenyl-3-methyl-5-hydroxy-6-metoxy-1,4-benzoquinol methylase
MRNQGNIPKKLSGILFHEKKTFRDMVMIPTARFYVKAAGLSKRVRSQQTSPSIANNLMKNLQRWITYNLWYFRNPPWESGIVPPEVNQFIADHPPGRALDLGCGTGTSSIALACAGWRVTGVDFSIQAIHLARRKEKLAQASVDFRIGDVIHLERLTAPYDLILDIGCFHNLPSEHQRSYRDNLVRLLGPGGHFLLYGIWKPVPSVTGPGFSENAISDLMSSLALISRQDGEDRQRPSAWFTFQKVDDLK